jgi:hypothetical protein
MCYVSNRLTEGLTRNEKEIVAEDSPINGGTQEETPPRQDVDVLLDVSELEVDRIKLTVRDLRAHVSVLAELASLVSLQVGVDARLDEVDLEIEGVRAKVLLKVRLDDVRAILKHALDTVAEHPEILRMLTRALNDLVAGRLGDATIAVQHFSTSAFQAECGRRDVRVVPLRASVASDNGFGVRGFPLPAFAGTSFAGIHCHHEERLVRGGEPPGAVGI